MKGNTTLSISSIIIYILYPPSLYTILLTTMLFGKELAQKIERKQEETHSVVFRGLVRLFIYSNKRNVFQNSRIEGILCLSIDRTRNCARILTIHDFIMQFKLFEYELYVNFHLYYK